ncbi:toprim domain-containing protein [Mycoplasmopsis alligatoris]|uniref:Recombination protein RecR n=1 Tax=Mycoplasmopsis alligatoris A21JP2 TaxID=747682 RepID=D4XWN0_9BACT|nr:toprim domain-containing protein [Mycoplasmopsis alligatoris]EFF41282.1 recombination protein RecR [Mycoplasmopsis alligatoris A21JP2]
MNEYDSIEKIIELLKRVDGISKKQAERILSWVIQSDIKDVETLLNSIKTLKNEVKECKRCGNLTASGVCNICLDEDRDNVLLVVEHFNIIKKMEKEEIYNGKYFVFKELLNIKNFNEKIEKYAYELAEYGKNFEEVILAISPTLEGAITNEYLKKYLTSKKINATSISIGVPVGASLDYIDKITIKQSIENRRK